MSDGIAYPLQDYDDLVDTIAGANHQLYQESLARWFSLIDKTPMFARVVSALKSRNDFDSWYRELQARQKGHGLGATQLNLPSDLDASIGMQITLFRRMANKDISAVRFAHVFIAPGDSNLDSNVAELSQQLFVPMARSLRRRLERAQLSGIDVDLELTAPASDRVVDLDHNAPEYDKLIQALGDVEQALSQSNDYDDQIDKEQRIAEISAGRELLKATRARAEALIAVIFRALSYLAKKFVDVAIGIAATAALALLGKLTGLW